jgi:hypothetical protein
VTVGLGLYRARMRSPCAGDALTPLWKVPKKTLSLSLSLALARSLALYTYVYKWAPMHVLLARHQREIDVYYSIQ